MQVDAGESGGDRAGEGRGLGGGKEGGGGGGGGEGYNHLQIVGKHEAFFHSRASSGSVWSLGISRKSGKECDFLPSSPTCIWTPSFSSALNGVF